MSTLDSKFSPEDVQTLIDAMDDWESMGNREYHFLQALKNLVVPQVDEDDEDSVRAVEAFKEFRSNFLGREKDINASRELRREQAVLLKAKLMMARRDIGINKLFDMASDPEAAGAPVEGVPEPAVVDPSGDVSNTAVPDTEEPVKLRLARAEAFIRKVKVWDAFSNFLAEKGDVDSMDDGVKLEHAEFYIQDLGAWSVFEKFLSES